MVAAAQSLDSIVEPGTSRRLWKLDRQALVRNTALSSLGGEGGGVGVPPCGFVGLLFLSGAWGGGG